MGMLLEEGPRDFKGCSPDIEGDCALALVAHGGGLDCAGGGRMQQSEWEALDLSDLR